MYLRSVLTLLPVFPFMMMTMGLAAAGNLENEIVEEGRDVLDIGNHMGDARILYPGQNILRKKVAAFFNYLIEKAYEVKVENAVDELHLSRALLDSSEPWSASDLDEYWSKVRGEESADYDSGVYEYHFDDLWSKSPWASNVKYWGALFAGIGDSEMFQTIRDSMKVYFVKTNAVTFGTPKENYGIVALATDNSGCRWVIFPGAQGIQLHYGTEGWYRKFDLEADEGVRNSANKVHRNYFDEWMAVRGIVETYIADAPRKVIFTGHSKGGLQAAHAAYYMTTTKSGTQKIAKNKVLLYVFGAPNLGNRRVSTEMSKHVGDYYKAKWYKNKNHMYCGILNVWHYYFTDIIAHHRFKYHRSDGDQDWTKTYKEYLPRGISKPHDFYTPDLESSNFTFVTLRGMNWGCGVADTSYWYDKKRKGTISGMSDKEKWDFELYQRAKAHQMSYYLSGLDDGQ